MATLKVWNGTEFEYVDGRPGPAGPAGPTGATGPAGEGASILQQDAEPSSPVEDDLWIDTDEDAQSGTAVFADYTPTLTQSGAVTKTSSSRYMTLGKLVMVWVRLDVTGTGTASNTVTVSLPVTAAWSNKTVGHGLFFDTSASDNYPLRVSNSGTDAVLFTVTLDDGTGVSLGAFAPVAAAIASGDVLTFFVQYEAA